MRKVRAMICPAKYVQGPGVTADCVQYIERFGQRVALIAGSTVGQLAHYKCMVDSLQSAGIQVQEIVRQPEITEAEIDRESALIRDAGGTDLVLGLGGGKALDTAKAVAHQVKAPVVCIPTIAATDAPTASSSVIYDEQGRFVKEVVWPANPNLVLVDSEIIVAAPVRYFVAGMGDALATWFEAQTASWSDTPAFAGGHQTVVGLAIARLCYDTLLTYARDAKAAAEKGIISHAVEKVIEANILMSGIGWESGGMAAAHSIHNGLTIRPESHAYYHGEKVAFGLLAQLALEDRDPAEIRGVIDLCLDLGLPVCLEDIGMSGLSRDEVTAIAEASCAPEETIHATPFKVNPPMVAEAILSADEMGARRKGERR